MIIQVFSLDIANALSNSNSKEFLENRENQWPELYLPNFKFSDTSQDLIYPEWFEGDWLVTSQDLMNDLEEPVKYKVNFLTFQSLLPSVVFAAQHFFDRRLSFCFPKFLLHAKQLLLLLYQGQSPI